MNTFCPGCNCKLKLKQLIPVKFSLVKHDNNNDNTKNKNNDNINKSNKHLSKKLKLKQIGSLGINNTNLNKEDNKYECGSCNKILMDSIKCLCLAKYGHIICFECVLKNLLLKINIVL